MGLQRENLFQSHDIEGQRKLLSCLLVTVASLLGGYSRGCSHITHRAGPSVSCVLW